MYTAAMGPDATALADRPPNEDASAMRRDRLHLLVASSLSIVFLVCAILRIRDATVIAPDGANYGVVARNLFRGDGYTESLVPFHAGTYDAVRHLPEMHGLLRPLELVPLFALLGVGGLPLRVPGLVYTALAGIVVFGWTRRLFGTAPAYLALALTLLNGTLFFYSVLATDDSGFAFYFIATLALLWRAMQEPRAGRFALAGIVAAVGMLEKPTGVMSLFLCVPAALWLREVAWPTAIRCLAAFAGGMLVVAALYATRNYVAHGSVGFRITPLDWRWRVEGVEGMMRSFDEAPTLLATLREIGRPAIVAIVSNQASQFFDAVIRFGPTTDGLPFRVLTVPAFLPVLGLCGIVLQAKREPALSALLAASVVGAFFVVCVLWHFELRYLTMLVPLFSIGVAGFVAWIARRGRLAAFVCAVAAVAVVVASANAFATAGRIVARLSGPPQCAGALEWIAAETTTRDRFLTFDPWFVAWAADRETIMIPTGGPAVIERVARRYDAHWLLAQPAPYRPATNRVVEALEAGSSDLRLTLRYGDRECRVYRVDWTDR
jgi:hypothetical protein